MAPESILPDQAFRTAAIHERERSVLVDAGAGTGKTTLIIERVVQMAAPTSPGVAPLPLGHLAVITFTRRAAGELRYRLRQRLLETLANAEADEARASLLREALGTVDTAYLGTIHSFADRLLRLRPVEAGVSPGYEITEDTGALVRETFNRLTHAAERRTLAAELAGRAVGEVPLTEVEETIRLVQEAGLRLESEEFEWGVRAGLDFLVGKMIETRDVVFVPALTEPVLDDLRASAARIASEIGTPAGTSRGARWLRRIVTLLREMSQAESLARYFRLARESVGRLPDLGMRIDFGGPCAEWGCFKRLRRDGDWRAELLDSLEHWMGVRIARCQEAVVALYERVKEERGVLDQLDLLLKLRDLLRTNPRARTQFQRLFDHILVDEFQDTDPLQCEIVFFLCEDGTAATTWSDVTLRAGSLTVVGDPKQSIYRFRRADIVMYADAHERITSQGALTGSLTTNFRSRPGLVQVVNEQFERLLRPVAPGESRFDRSTGSVRYERIEPAPRIAPAAAKAVHLLPYAGTGGAALNAADGRPIEAAALASYIQHLVGTGHAVRDPESGCERPLRFGDVVVLAPVTTDARLLLRAFDRLGIRYSAHGGTLFLTNPIVRLYLLGLRALADRRDGVAEAALMRPPFFGLDLIDVLSSRLDGEVADVARARSRLAQAREIVRALRRDRFTRPPVDTGIDLIERTALGRSVVTGPNGRQVLDSLYEIAYELGHFASTAGLDFDGATAELRRWVDAPIQLKAPQTTDPDTVRVMTIHAAKGLEFPVVVLWDGFAQEKGRVEGRWVVPRDGGGLALAMDGLRAEMPPSGALLQLEQSIADAERQRLFYVAATRARDLLVIPTPCMSSRSNKMLPALLQERNPMLSEQLDLYRSDALPVWAGTESADVAAPVVDEVLARRIGETSARFEAGFASAAASIAVPTAVTSVAHEAQQAPQIGETPLASAVAPVVVRLERSEGASNEVGVEDDQLREDRGRKPQGSRFGTVFGSTVHRALQLGLTGARGAPADWVAVAAEENGLGEHLGEAVEDVQRAIAALASIGVTHGRAGVQSEYPVSVIQSDGRMLTGVIDCLVEQPAELIIIDFKTDKVPENGATEDPLPGYRRQLVAYAHAVRAAGVAGTHPLRAALLFTENGRLLGAG